MKAILSFLTLLAILAAPSIVNACNPAFVAAAGYGGYAAYGAAFYYPPVVPAYYATPAAYVQPQLDPNALAPVPFVQSYAAPVGYVGYSNFYGGYGFNGRFYGDRIGFYGLNRYAADNLRLREAITGGRVTAVGRTGLGGASVSVAQGRGGRTAVAVNAGGGAAVATARGGLFGGRSATAVAGNGGAAVARVGRR
jgi:hypothetical protein